MEIEKVSIIGCGALGLMYANHFSKSLAPGQLKFIADPTRIDRYRASEFVINGEAQSFEFVSSELPAAAVEPSDLVIFAVKSYGLADAIRSVQGHVGKETLIVSFLNGISSEGVIAQAYDPQKVVSSMVAGMDSTKVGNCVNYSQVGYVAFGSEAGRVQNDPADLARLARFFDQVKQPYVLQEDVTKPMWWKYMLNVGINQTSALLKAPYRLFQESAYAQEIMLMSMREVSAVAKELGIELNEGDIDEAIRIIHTLSPDGKTSMFQDIDAQRPSEVDIFSGSLMALAKEHEVPVPVNTFLYNAIKALESQYVLVGD